MGIFRMKYVLQAGIILLPIPSKFEKKSTEYSIEKI